MTDAELSPVEGPRVWRGPGVAARGDEWTHAFSEVEIAELDAAVEDVLSCGRDVLEITRDNFSLPLISETLTRVQKTLQRGLGFMLLRGVPVDRYDARSAATAYFGIGAHLGEAVSQNAKGHLLGHVTDLVGKDLGNPNHRGYQTSAELHYHGDSCDLVALLCLRQARSSGLTSAASAIAIHNEMLRRRPDLVAALAGPWYRDRREEVPPGKQPWFVLPVFNYVDDHLVTTWQGQYIRSAQRFEDVPKFTAAQEEAVAMLSELAYGVRLAPGDMLLLHNHVVLHARTAFHDHADRRRHLLRL